jgi:hypothetical protein
MYGGPWAVFPATVTVTFPVEVPKGTVVTIDVSLQLTTLATAPQKLATLLLCVEPKPVPVIVTVVPTGPIAGDRPVTERPSMTVNDAVLLEKPASFTETEPLVVLAGTVAVMLVSLQAVAVAAIPLNNTWLPLEPVPKPEPVNVTVPPMGAAGGAMLVITGLIAVNVATGTLAIEFTVTLTGPGPEGTAAGTTATICEVLQLVTVAAAPLKVIVLLP